QCFRALGVFVGSWTLEAAEAICWTEIKQPSEVWFLTFAALVESSLIQVATLENGQTRFNMLELIRDYACQRLRASGEMELCQRRHAVYYSQLAERAWSQGSARERIEAFVPQDMPNMRMAILWAEEQQEIVLGLQLARFSWGGWVSQSQISETEEVLKRMLAMSWQRERQEKLFEIRALALYACGQSLLRRDKIELAREAACEALERARRNADSCSMCGALAILGQIAQRNGNLNEAATFLEESDRYARLEESAALRSFTLRNLAELARMQGDLPRATTLYEEALAVARALEMTFGVALIMTLLGHLTCQQQNYTQAQTYYREGLALLKAFDSPTYTAWCLEGYVAVLSTEASFTRVTRLCAAAATLREQVQTPLPPAEYEAFEQIVARAKIALGERAFQEEWTRGAHFNNRQAIDHALSIPL
ncbi:MAG TPA: tetratricopeptide repeat protein, partial [Ktedonobacteraceae bacterium]|nr:tetratricopeptide repeat protein [Ktedonobacteraceae bacterium]